jgi:O-antigen/teichoic acid export membrane protein
MLSSYTVLALEKQWSLLGIGIAALVVNVGANLILIPEYSYEGSAVATLLTEVTALTLLLATIHSRLHYLPSFRTALRMAPILVASGAAALYLTPDSLIEQILIMAIGVVAAYTFSGAISISTIRAMLGGSRRAEAKPYAAPTEIGAGR